MALPFPLSPPRFARVRPALALCGARVAIEGGPFPLGDLPPRVRVGGADALVCRASSGALAVQVPLHLEGGPTPIRVDGLAGETAFVEVGILVATGVHQVDGPVLDDDGTVYLTFSGSRGQQAPVSVYRARGGQAREIFVTGLTNPTSMARGPDGRLYVSSRFDGTVSRVEADGRFETVVTDVGVACGLAFDAEGRLLVGDRSGTIFRVEPGGETTTYATLPPSVAAFHLAMAPSGDLYVSGPTLATCDAVYRVSPDGRVEVASRAFGRPQGLAFDPQGRLHVAEALAGASGIYRLDPATGATDLVVAGVGVIGLAFDRKGNAAVTTSDSVYWFPASAFP